MISLPISLNHDSFHTVGVFSFIVYSGFQESLERMGDLHKPFSEDSVAWVKSWLNVPE